MRHANLLDPALLFPHSHSIVPGGFDVTSYTTRLTPLISLMMCPHDMQIGGHARSEGLIIVSNNMREFSRMQGIRVENWA